MKLILRLYSIYASFVFIVSSLFFVPFLSLLAQRRQWHLTALRSNSIWSWSYFHLIGIPIKFTYQQELEKGGQYIFCANHFSYMDIPVISGLAFPFKFIGKSSLTRVPLFGYMFKKLHITVNRANARSRVASLNQTRIAIEQGFSVTFFPEGGIISTTPPHMAPLKDGAFRLSVEKNIPIIPVTMPDNYRLLPDDESYLCRPVRCRVIVHEPIYPADHGNNHDQLKKAVSNVIQTELLKYHSQIVDAVS